MKRRGGWRGWAVAAAAALSSCACRAQVTASINASATAVPVAQGFAGCSVEMSSMGTWSGTYVPGSPALFDQSLVNFLNLLAQYEGPPFIRIGGNSQDRSWLQIYDNAVIPPFDYTAAPTPNAFNPAEVNGLAWVQELTGCPFSIGLNMGGELRAEAVEEMNAFNGLFAPGGIAAFDVGNEPDESDFASYRPAGWSESRYQSDLVNFLGVLRPEAPIPNFAAPAVGGTSWLPKSATTAFNSLLTATKGDLLYVTAHIYIANGEDPGTSDPTGLLFEPAHSSQIASTYTATQSAAGAFGLPVRINETNTFYNGGLAGVSDAFASALWVADVLGSYAEAGIVGVNFHGGSSGPYTPFTMTQTASGFTVAAEPVYYGMMAFAQFIQNEGASLGAAAPLAAPGAGVFPVSLSGASSGTASAYASRDSTGALRVLILNKSETSALTATLSFTNLPSGYQSQGSLILLQAPSLSSTTGVTLAGQSYDGNGNVIGAYASQAISEQTPGTPTYTVQIPLAAAGIFHLDLASPVAPSVSVQTSGVPALGGPIVANAAVANPGEPVAFVASAQGSPPFSYQWSFNGAPIPGATGMRLVVSDAEQANVGTYTVTVSNSAGSATSAPWALALEPVLARLVNLSSRVQLVSNANPAIAGFVIGGSVSRTVLIRAAGPSLSQFGIASPLPHPSLTLYTADGFVAGTNTGWSNASNTSAISAAEQATSAFAFAQGSADSAMLVTLAPGSYTAQVTDASGASGVTLTEVYQADSGYGTGQLGNISTRASVGTGANILVSGFVVGGSGSEQVLIRGIGPALSQFSVSDPLAAPVLQVYGANETLIATNTGWDANGQGPAVAAAEAATGAFALPAGSADTAVVLTLQPGSYTVEISGANGTTGTALAEVWEIPTVSPL